jgi:hypothetical protein
VSGNDGRHDIDGSRPDIWRYIAEVRDAGDRAASLLSLAQLARLRKSRLCALPKGQGSARVGPLRQCPFWSAITGQSPRDKLNESFRNRTVILRIDIAVLKSEGGRVEY